MSLTVAGRAEVRVLARHFTGRSARALLSSPRERCLQTADIITAAVGLSIETAEDLDEIDFGDWTGKRFDQLNGDADWRRWNEARGEARTPSGDSMAAATTRMQRALAKAAALGGAILVSHAEPIRAAIADILGFPLQRWSRLLVSTASLTEIDYDAGGSTVVAVNQTFS